MVLPAVRVSSNGNKTFYNQVLAAYTGWVDKRNDYGKAVTFGDDTPLPKEIIEDLDKFMLENQCAYRWTAGQFCIVDNSVAYHSRSPFKGTRKVMAAIGDGFKEVKTKVPQHVLHSGDVMPAVGFGCWKVGKEICANLVYTAIKNGYRLIDEACIYHNEVQAGEGIAQAISEGIVKREDLFITSKLWNNYHRKEHVMEACKRGLKQLGLEYLDLYLIHFPVAHKYIDMDQEYPPSVKTVNDEDVSIRETW